MAIMPQERSGRIRERRKAREEAAAEERPGLSDAMLKDLRSPPSPYEVRCYSCDTSFAPGTRRCIHCGMRLGRASPIADAAVGEGGLVTGGEEEEEELRPGGARNLIWIITALAMLVGSALRACQSP